MSNIGIEILDEYFDRAPKIISHFGVTNYSGAVAKFPLKQLDKNILVSKCQILLLQNL